jgi:hypothetical protein
MSSKQTCPSACPFKEKGCYAAISKMNIHWLRLTRGAIGVEFPEFISKLKALPDNQLTRLNQAGDLPGIGNRINRNELNQIVEAGKGKRFFTYTHKPVLGDGSTEVSNREAIKQANDNGTVINLSANNLHNADELKALGIGPVVVVLPLGSPNTVFTPAGNKVVKCPNQYKEYVTCSTCQLCAKDRSVIVGFEAHGIAKKTVSAIAAS